MRGRGIIILLGLLLFGCKTPQYVPVEHQVIYNYVDSLRIKDSTVVIPVERVVDIVPVYDTLVLETSKAVAKSWVDTTFHGLRGSIENKTGVEYKHIYQDRIVVKDSLVFQDVPVPVEVVKTVHPDYEWVLWVWFVASLVGLFILGYCGLRR